MNRNLDFLGIEAQKAGTTWLYHILSSHPDVRMPPIKELHFFDEAEAGNKQNILYKLFVENKFNRKRKDNLIEGCIRSIRNTNIEELRWCIKYSLLSHRFEAKYLQRYDHLFSSAQNIITGEITPAYSILSKTSISIIKEFYPDLRIILILRDPVERAWSQLRMGIKKKGKDYYTHQRILNFIHQDNLRGNYPGIIQNWTNFFQENLLILFYDELLSDPQEFLGKINNFLGLSPCPFQKLGQRINVGIKAELSPVYRKLFIEKYMDDAADLADRFQNLPINYPLNWLQNYQEFLAAPDNESS